MIYSFELDEADSKFVEAYAAETGESVGVIAKNALLEHVEDVMDLKAAIRAKAEYEANPVSYSMDEATVLLEIDR